MPDDQLKPIKKPIKKSHTKSKLDFNKSRKLVYRVVHHT